ncbi:hypothetical protein, partial [Cylindrospermum sp. FACHB-282]|uniref:hypothetical protein n=1 Tax=Cylindrospermum sp. FACHB-282 TaxID=2692794 RepID=UPI0016882885
MAEPTRQQVFGANSTETLTELVIFKDDLAEPDKFIPAAQNKAEQLFAAIFKRAIAVFLSDSYSSNIEQSIVITENTKSYSTRSDASSVLVRSYTVEFNEP